MAGAGALGEGVMGGYLGTQLDIQQIQLNQDKLQMDPVALQQAQVNLQKDKIQLAQQVKMLSLMQNIKPPKDVSDPNSISEVFDQMSMIQLESGMPDAAAKTASVASKIAEDASKIDYRTFRMQNDRMGKFANILSTSQDSPAGFAQAIQAMIASDPRVVNDPKFKSLAQQGWRPGLVPMLERSVLSAKEQAEVDYRKKAGDHAETAAILDTDRRALVHAQTQLDLARVNAVKKEGGVVVKAGQLKVITDQVLRDYPGAIDEDVRVRSRPLAEEMVQMMKTNHLTESEAATRVYERARTEGVFTGLKIAPVRKGAKPGTPLDKPSDPKKAQQNLWYKGADGVSRVLIGNKYYSEEQLEEIDNENELLGLDDHDDAD